MGKKIKIIFPAPLNEHTRELIETQIPAEYIRPEFDVEFAGSKRLMSQADSYTEQADFYSYLKYPWYR